MAAKPLTSEAVAVTEKKVDMALDDIIKMSKKSTNGKRQRRVSNKNQKPVNGGAKEAALKVRRYMDSRSSVRQGFLAKRRSNFQQNHFPLAAEAAQKAAVAPLRARAYNAAPRVGKFNKPRGRAPPAHRRSPNGGFASKPQHQNREQQGKSVPKQKPQTLDSLFASMKEERTKVFSPQQNNPVQRNGGGGGGGGGSGGWRRPPWMRRQFGH